MLVLATTPGNRIDLEPYLRRVSKLEECMICEKLPCECDGVTQAKTRSRRVETKPAPVLETPSSAEPTIAVRRSMRDKMKAAAAETPRLPVAPTPPPSSRRIRHSENDFIFAAAVRNLEPILHPDEKATYSQILQTEQSVEERQAFWKARHKDLTND